MINESKDSIDWKIIKVVKQTCLIENDDEMIKCDVFVLKTKTQHDLFFYKLLFQ
jgi:hypothetical protein